jgi:cytochrome c oxidase subunit IV
VEIIAFIGFIVFAMNLNQIVWYLKLAGLPYKSRKHYYYVRKVGIGCLVWSLAFIFKLIAAGFGVSLFQENLESVDVYQACVLGFTDFVTIVIPYYYVIDSDFVKIMWCKHLSLQGVADSDVPPNQADE